MMTTATVTMATQLPEAIAAHTLELLEVRQNAYGDVDQYHGSEQNVICIMAAIGAATKKEIFDGHLSAFCDYCKQKMHEEIDEVDLYEPREG